MKDKVIRKFVDEVRQDLKTKMDSIGRSIGYHNWNGTSQTAEDVTQLKKENRYDL